MKIELYHDILAQRVYQMASSEEQMRLKVENFIRSRYDYSLQQGVLLGKEDLEYINPYLDGCFLDPPELDFVQKSKIQLLKEQRKKRQLLSSIIAILTLCLAFALFQWWRSETSIKKQRKMSLALMATEALNNGDPSLAFHLLKKSRQIKVEDNTRGIIQPILQELIDSRLKCDLYHSDSITAFDIADTVVATADQSGLVQFWNTNCQRRNFSYSHASRLNILRFSPN